MQRAMRLQGRDTRLLAELGEVGVMDTALLWQRHFPADRTGRACLRRLQRYAAHGLTRALPVSVSYADGRRGRLPTLHCLTPRGAEVLLTLTGVPPRRVLRHDPKPETLLHRLGVARLQLTVNDACVSATLPRPQWILEQDTCPGVALSAPLSERFVLYETFPTSDGHHVTCRPDASCWIRMPSPGQRAGPLWHDLLIYWEYDRSTELLRQVARKVPGYQALLAGEVYRKHWPKAVQPTVRVFFIPQSDERLRNLAAALRGHLGAESFRFATAASLTPEHFFTTPIWQTVAGDPLSILRSEAPPLASP